MSLNASSSRFSPASVSRPCRPLRRRSRPCNEHAAGPAPRAQREHAGQEVADILMYLTLLCSELGIDMDQALEAKLADNERRFAV